MTRDREPVFPPVLDWLPRPPALQRDPELALLAVLHTALEALELALFAVHPHLGELDRPPDVETLAAHRLIIGMWEFHLELDSYCGRIAARTAASQPDDEDIEF